MREDRKVQTIEKAYQNTKQTEPKPPVLDDTNSNKLGRYMTIESKHQRMFGTDQTPKHVKELNGTGTLPKKRVKARAKKIVYTGQVNQKNLLTMAQKRSNEQILLTGRSLGGRSLESKISEKEK